MARKKVYESDAARQQAYRDRRKAADETTAAPAPVKPSGSKPYDYVQDWLPPELARKIASAAAGSGRSFRDEIVARLERSFPAVTVWPEREWRGPDPK